MSEISMTARPAWWAAADSAQLEPPEWVLFTESALRRGTGPARTADDDPCAPFGRVLAAFTATAVDRLRAATADLPGIDLPRVLADTAADLTRRLGTLAARTFVYELHLARPTLTGGTGAERFADFLRGVDLPALLARYPVLARVVAQTCLRTVDAVAELLARLAADRADVARLLGGDPGPLVALRAGAGDRHRGGRSAALLEFADGRGVAYQPRSLELHARFGELVAWLDQHVRLDLRAAACVVRPGYGWVERISHTPCRSADEVALFYRRQGALLALLYALDATDIHYENLIAAGGHPVLVDVETLFHPVFPAPSATGPDPAEAALGASVVRTALLPVMAYGDGGALDVSGIGAAAGWYPAAVTRWVDAGTDAMRLERVRVPFTGGDHRPVLDGRPADPAAHIPDLLSGFRAAYEAIGGHAARFAGLLARCADAETRVVLRHTHRYADLLTDATHPDLLRSAADRDRLFALLRTEPVGVPGAIDHEIAQLWAGDIPTFHSRPASRHIWTGDGACLPHRLARTGLRAATDKLARMGPVDQRAQEWVIQAAFASRGAPVRHAFAPGPAGPGHEPAPEFGADRVLAAAVGVAEDIARRAVHGPGRVNWLGVEPLDDRFWAVLPMGAGLLNGYCGVALFLAQAGVLADRPDLRALAARAVAPVGALVDRFAADPGLARMAGGGMAGVGGVGYALARIADLLDAADLRERAEAAVPVIADATDPDAASVHDGVAGALLACLAVGSPAALALADALAVRLAALTPTEPGFLHGAAGVGHALLAHGHRAAGHRALDAAAAADVADAGWCAGRAGIALACAHAGRPVPFDAPGAAADASLCHGETGVLTAIAAHAGWGMTARRGAHLLGALAPPGPRGGAPSGIATPGLLTGAAGVGYGLLHLAFPDRVPSVLLFAPGKHGRTPAKEG